MQSSEPRNRAAASARSTLGWCAAWLLFGCSYDWDAFDPRLAASTAQSGGSDGGGGAHMGGDPSGGGGAGAGGNGAGGAGGMGLGPFGPPELVQELSDPDDDDDPCISADGLAIIFNSGRNLGTSTDFWLATRASLTAPWENISIWPEVSSPDRETNGAPSWDGLTFWLSSDRDDIGGDEDLYVSTRSDRASPWPMPVLVPELSSTAFDEIGGVSGDGLQAVMCSTRSGTYRLYSTTRMSLSSAWTMPMPIAELVTGGEDCSPWLSDDALTIYFDAVVAGNADIYMATRPSRSATWNPPVPVAELNTSGDDSDPTLTLDQRHIIFARGTAPTREIWQATR